MNEWQTIDTAPIQPFRPDSWYMRHSPELLLWNGYSVQLGSYNFTKTGKGKWTSSGRIMNSDPTHWMALPLPPSAPLKP